MSHKLCRAMAMLMSLLWSAGFAAAQAGRATRNSGNNTQGKSVRVSADSAISARADRVPLSRNFAAAGLRADDLLRVWQRHIAYTFQNGYPLSELSIDFDRDRAADALGLAALAASNDADRAALEQLRNLFESLQRWSDDLVEDKRNLRLARYYMSPTALDDDPVFQKNTECGRFIALMLAGKQLAEAPPLVNNSAREMVAAAG